jgi:hypothetical protein
MALLERAGIDLAQPDTVRAVIDQLDSLVTRLESELASAQLDPSTSRCHAARADGVRFVEVKIRGSEGPSLGWGFNSALEDRFSASRSSR